jgi:DNA repair protein RadC
MEAWEECPTERLTRLGEEALAEHELVALLLTPARGGRDLDLALRLLRTAGGLGGLARQPLEDLARQPGIGPARARRLKAALELGRRVVLPAFPRDRALVCPIDVAEWFRGRLQDRSRESLHALLLDARNRPLSRLCLAEGTWSSCPVDPRVVFSACLRLGASAVILIHNHPSGDPSPSSDDLQITERLARAGQLLGVRVLDHLIVAREGICSLADRGLLSA